MTGDDAGDAETRESRSIDLSKDRSARSLRRQENKTGRRASDLHVNQIATRKVVVVSDVVIVAVIIISEVLLRAGFCP